MVERSRIELAMRGDAAAYEDLVHAVARPLYLAAYRILRDGHAAEDAVQQAFLRMWRELPRLRDPERFEAWAYRLVVRAAIDETRRSKRQARFREVKPAVAFAPDASAEIAARDALDQAFRTLSVDHRAVVVLHYYVGMSIAEIAATLDVPYGTVGSRLHYALRSMRTAFGLELPQGAGVAGRGAGPERPMHPKERPA